MQFSAAFLKHYSMFVEDEYPMAYLWNIQQLESESLKNYMSRFKGVMAKISSIDNDFSLTALKNGLWYNSIFHLEMTVNHPLTIEDVIHRAWNFSKAEEDISSLDKKHTANKELQTN